MDKINLHCSDPVEVENSTYRAAIYLMQSEVKDFLTCECIKSHIFVDAVVIFYQFHMSERDENFTVREIHNLTEDLINKFDEDKADKLYNLVETLKLKI